MKIRSLLVLASALYPIALLAQPISPQASDDSQGGINDIIVTAQKGARGESVQKVAVAITALDASALSAGKITDLTQAGRIAPGVQLMQPAIPGYPNFFIRGLGLSGSVRTLDPTVSINVDGMPQEFATGTILDVEDFQSVEILRGPQGILFGRNATGGAVNVTSKRPTKELHVEGLVRLGTDARRDAYGLISGPIVEDKILGKLSVLYKHSAGTYKDRNGGTFVPAPLNPSGLDTSEEGKREIGENVWAIRPTLELRPSEDFTITLLGDYRREEGGGVPARVVTNVPNLLTFYGYTADPREHSLNHNYGGHHLLKTYRAIAELQYRTEVGVFTAVSGFRKVDYELDAADIDGTPFTFFHFPDNGNVDHSKQYSQEVRFASDFSDRVRFVVGGYYSKLKFHGIERRILNRFFAAGDGTATGNNLLGLEGKWRQSGTTKAVFYNIEVEPFSSLKLTHGGRYTKDHKDFLVFPLRAGCAVPAFTGCQTTSASSSKSWDNYSPKFSLEWTGLDHTMLYASWTKGYRSGNFNSRAPNLLPENVTAADPETIAQIEAGIKTTFFDGRARINVAAFTSKYNDIQRTVNLGLVQVLRNAATARIKGVEVETTFEPVKNFVINGNVGYLDAKFLKFENLDVNGGGYDPAVDPILAKNLKFEQVPKWTAYVAAAYTFQLSDNGPEFNARVSYSYKGKLFGETLNQAPVDSYGLIDGSIGASMGNWRISLYGKNITNKFYSGQTSVFNFGPGAFGTASPRFGIVQYGNPGRELGVELGFKL